MRKYYTIPDYLVEELKEKWREGNMAKPYTIEAVVEKVGEIQTFPSGFRKQEIVLDTGGDYPDHLAFDFLKDNIEKITDADVMVGDKVEVAFYLRGREYNGKYYTNLVGIDLRVTGMVEREEAPAPDDDSEGNSDLPF